MRCPWCGAGEGRVVDSREVERGSAVRRRRECRSCERRFTTYERTGQVATLVLKRSGQPEPFDRAKVVAGVVAACKNRPVSLEAIDELADRVEDLARGSGREITSKRVGLAVLELLRSLDEVASVRFASVYKGFEEVEDFERELDLLQEDVGLGRPPAR